VGEVCVNGDCGKQHLCLKDNAAYGSPSLDALVCEECHGSAVSSSSHLILFTYDEAHVDSTSRSLMALGQRVR